MKIKLNKGTSIVIEVSEAAGKKMIRKGLAVEVKSKAKKADKK